MAEYPLASQSMSLGRYASDVNAVVQAWDAAGNVGRLWRRDASLFSGADEARWMAWLDIVDIQLNETSHLLRAAEDAAGGNGGAPFQNVVVLGMGWPWQSALGAVFVSGCLFLLVTLTGVREQIVKGIPHSLRIAITVGIGMFLAPGTGQRSKRER